MKSNSVLCLLVILGLSAMLGQADSIVTDYQGIEDQRPVCRAPGQFQWDSEDLELEFDYSSFAADQQKGDSVPIFVTKGDDTNTWKFTFFQNTLEQPIEQECINTQNLEFVALLDEFLFLTNLNNERFVCKMNLASPSTSSLPLLTLGAPASEVTGTITTFIPYWKSMNTGDGSYSLHVFLGDSTGGATFIYYWPQNPLHDTQISVGGMIGLKFPSSKPFTTFIGSGSLFYDSFDNKFVYKDNPGDTTWSEDTVIPPANSVVSQYRLLAAPSIFTIMNQNGIGGAVYQASGTMLTELPYTDSTTQTEAIYSDNLFNFVLVSDTDVLWFSYVFDIGTFCTVAPRTEIQLGGTELVDISLSGSKLVALFKDKIQYFKHEAYNDIKLIYEKTLTDEFDFDSDISAKILISCLCESLKKFVCYSSTLNCIIIKKGGAECYEPDIVTFVGP